MKSLIVLATALSFVAGISPVVAAEGKGGPSEPKTKFQKLESDQNGWSIIVAAGPSVPKVKRFFS